MKYSFRGRTVLMEFKCGRCGITHTEPYELQLKETEGNIQFYKPPKGWIEDDYTVPLLCPKCAEEFREFMNYKKEV